MASLGPNIPEIKTGKLLGRANAMFNCGINHFQLSVVLADQAKVCAVDEVCAGLVRDKAYSIQHAGLEPFGFRQDIGARDSFAIGEALAALQIERLRGFRNLNLPVWLTSKRPGRMRNADEMDPNRLVSILISRRKTYGRQFTCLFNRKPDRTLRSRDATLRN